MCRSNKSNWGAVHEIEQESRNMNHIYTITINSITSDSKQSVTVAKLKFHQLKMGK